ncbi:MAG: NAD(P)/FAD-dependent oxidoreductase, partial [Chitinophagaceae bacterium]|nr:NAD(P)/FAD-dependent oxidoreductase [Rubrivivax sp.]
MPDTSPPPHDAIIMGGGLAGLTLALQLKQRFADLDVLVLERRAHPVPHACHKVGESSVEIGAHYFENVLGLKQHLKSAQLKKFGFRFFFSDGQRDIARVTEIGVSHALPVPSWQIDRGIFENYLAEEAQARGVRFVDQAMVRQVHLSDDDALHAVTWQRPGEELQRSSARWLLDASGRAGLIKRQLGLAQENAHAAHAVWFRVNRRITLDDWSHDADWRARTVTPTRWLSTNHLVGEGYWVWLIPLASGSHSVGIVADPKYHPHETMNTFERAMDWLRKHQPRLFEDLEDVLTTAHDSLQDFAFFRRFSYDCKQIFSAQRWALTGEAGRFLDPFYSPGSDFIAIGNTYITELIARDRAGQPLKAHTQIYDQAFRSFYDSTLALYTDQYGLFADPEVLPHKVIWDYTYYWGVLSQMFFQGRLADLASMSHLRDELAHCQNLNLAVQTFLREWGGHSQRRNPAVMLDQASMPWFAALNGSLMDTLDDAAFRARLRESAARLTALAQELLQRGCGEHPKLDG